MVIEAKLEEMVNEFAFPKDNNSYGNLPAAKGFLGNCKERLSRLLFTSAPRYPNKTFERYTMTELIDAIEHKNEPKPFKDALLGALQLFYDGIVKFKLTSKNPDIWREQEEVLQAMISSVRLTVAQYYKSQPIPFHDVRECVLPYSEQLVRYGLKGKCKIRHLDKKEHELPAYISDVTEALDDKQIDLIIPIASGGFEPACLTADYLNVANMLPIRCSRVSRSDTRVVTPYQAPEDYALHAIQGKHVLLVDDILLSGGTSSKTIKWVQKHNPGSTYFAVVLRDTDSRISKNLHPISENAYLYEGI